MPRLSTGLVRLLLRIPLLLAICGIGFLMSVRDVDESSFAESGARFHLADDGRIIGLVFDGISPSESELRTIRELKDLRIIDLSNCEITDEMVRVIAGKPSLATLKLDGSTITDQQLSGLGAHEKLHSVSLCRTSRLQHGLASLPLLPGLQRLQLNACEWLKDDEFKAVTRFPSLLFLDCSSTEVSEESLKVCQDLPHLRHLLLDDCPRISDSALDALALIPSLGVCGLSGTRVSLGGVAAYLSANPERRIAASLDEFFELEPYRKQIDGIGGIPFGTPVPGLTIRGADSLDLSFLRFLDRLTDLRVNDRNLSDADFAEISDVANLRSLTFSGVTFPETTNSPLPEFPSLRAFALVKSRLTDNLAGAIARCQDLEELDLNGSVVTDEQLTIIGAGCQKLRKLNLSATPVHGSSLASFSLLGELNVADSGFDDTGLKALTALKQLRELRAANTKITGESLSGTSGLNSLRDLLDVSGTQVGTTFLSALQADQLHRLNISSTPVTDDDVRLLDRCAMLSVLLLSKTAVTGRGPGQLTHTALRHLDLSGTRVTDEGVAGLQDLRELVSLDLSDSACSGEALGGLPFGRDSSGPSPLSAASQDSGASGKTQRASGSVAVSASDLTPEGASAIANNPGIGTLSLKADELDEQVCKRLFRSASIDNLQIPGQAGIVRALSESPLGARLVSLTLRNPDVEAIECLTGFPRLKSLTLQESAFNEDLIPVVAGVINPTGRSMHLHLQNCDITREQLLALIISDGDNRASFAVTGSLNDSDLQYFRGQRFVNLRVSRGNATDSWIQSLAAERGR